MPSLCLSGVLAAGLAVPAHAEDSPPRLAAQFGYDGFTRVGEWMPVQVDVGAAGKEFNGILEIEVVQGTTGFGPANRDPFGPGSEGIYQLPLTVPPLGVKHVRTYVLPNAPGDSVVVRLVRDRDVLANRVAPSQNTDVLVGVLSDDAAALGDFGAVKLPGNLTPLVVHLQADDLPDSAATLRAFNLLAIDDFPTDRLTAAQRSAVADYVASGGSLLLGTGAAWRKTLAGLDRALLPLLPADTLVLPEAAALPAVDAAAGRCPDRCPPAPRDLEVVTGAVDGLAWLSDATHPLMIEKALGRGTISLATFDWAVEPIASWNGARSLLRQVLIRNQYGQAQTVRRVAGTGEIGGWVLGRTGPADSTVQRMSALSGALAAASERKPPSLRIIGLLLLAYVAIIVINYLLLRRLRRRELAWISLPVIAALFAASTYSVGLAGTGQAVLGRQVSLIYASADWDRAYRERHVVIATPSRGDYTIRTSGRPLIAPTARGGASGGVLVGPQDGTVDLLGVPALSVHGLTLPAMVPAPKLIARAQLQPGRLRGQVENRSSMAFSDAVLVAGNAFEVLGTLPPGATAPFEVSLNASMANPASLAERAYPEVAETASRLGITRGESVLRARVLDAILGSDRGLVGLPAVLVAWSRDPLEPLMVNGRRLNAGDETAVLVPLTVTLSAGVPAAGFSAARVTDATGLVNAGLNTVSQGSITFEFAGPLVSGLDPSSVVVQASPRLDPATVQLEAWDWTHAGWVALPLRVDSSIVIPRAAVDPDSSTVRLRLRAPSAAFSVPVFRLTGRPA